MGHTTTFPGAPRQWPGAVRQLLSQWRPESDLWNCIFLLDKCYFCGTDSMKQSRERAHFFGTPSERHFTGHTWNVHEWKMFCGKISSMRKIIQLQSQERSILSEGKVRHCVFHGCSVLDSRLPWQPCCDEDAWGLYLDCNWHNWTDGVVRKWKTSSCVDVFLWLHFQTLSEYVDGHIIHFHATSLPS